MQVSCEYSEARSGHSSDANSKGDHGSDAELGPAASGVPDG